MNYISIIKIIIPSTITFGACKYLKKANTMNDVPMHPNTYTFQKNP